MEINEKNLANDAEWQRKQPTYGNEPDATPRREGGDDALSETTPTDPDADEKVLTNDPVKNAGQRTQEGEAGKEA
jgi:hypothetical protein